jgi:CheY-like chemotaxis protein
LGCIGGRVRITHDAQRNIENARLMRQDKPDVALLDVMMSYVLDGINLTRQMRDDPELRNIPVIMISAIVSREEAGAFPTDEYLSVNTFMTKPVDPAHLLRQVAALIQHGKSGETKKEG